MAAILDSTDPILDSTDPIQDLTDIQEEYARTEYRPDDYDEEEKEEIAKRYIELFENSKKNLFGSYKYAVDATKKPNSYNYNTNRQLKQTTLDIRNLINTYITFRKRYDDDGVEPPNFDSILESIITDNDHYLKFKNIQRTFNGGRRRSRHAKKTRRNKHHAKKTRRHRKH